MIYHYCGVSGLFGIMDSKKIWLSRFDSLNDKLEYAIPKEAIMKAAINTDFKKLPDILKDWVAELLYRYDNCHSRPVFILSFSKNGDLLSQWSMYADDCHGFSLGYEEKDFKNIKIMNPYRSSSTLPGLYGTEVEYATIEDLISFYEGQFQKILKSGTLHPELINVYMPMTRFKHKSFSQEEEYRIVYFPSSDMDKSLNMEPKCRVSGKAIVPYYEIPCDLPRKVILGPKNPMSEEQVYSFLSHYADDTKKDSIKKDIEVVRSGSSYQ